MPFEAHKAFEQPPDDTTIWRYMKLHRFAELLEHKALWFTRSDRVGDPFEGAYPKAAIDARTAMFPPGGIHTPETWSRLIASLRLTTLLSCWHISNHESVPMWSMYAGAGKGVAVKSTVGRLKRAFDAFKTEPVYLGSVKYIDYGTDSFDQYNAFHAFVHKRLEFKDERELRAVMQHVPLKPGPVPGTFRTTLDMLPQVGLYVPVQVETLIEGVVVSPQLSDTTFAAVGGLMAKAGLKVQPARSNLAAPPSF